MIRLRMGSLLFGFLFASSAFGIEHSLQCDGKGLLKSYSTSLDAPVTIKDDKIILTNPVDSYYSNRSGEYSVSKIKYLIELAVKNGVDPYYALSTVLLENPDTLRTPPDAVFDESNLSAYYERQYGTIPLNSIAKLDILKCQYQELPFSDRRHNRAGHFLLKDFPGNDDFYKEVVKIDQQLMRKKISKEDAKKEKARIFEIMFKNGVEAIPSEKRTADNLEYRKLLMSMAICVTPVQMKVNGPEISACRGIVTPQKNVPTFEIGKGSSRQVCAPPALLVAGSAGFLMTNEQINAQNIGSDLIPMYKGCCANVSAPADMDDKQLLRDVQVVMGFEFMKNKIQTSMDVAQNMEPKSETQRMALVLQGFNGYGTIGTTLGESANRCLNGMNLKKTPVYGAGTGEAILNVFMGNSEIRKMVSQAAKKTPVHSVFCEVLGSGKHEFSAVQFAKVQESGFAGRRCPKHTYSYADRTPGKTLSAPAKGTH